MPVFYEQVNEYAKIAIWHIAEEKNFFLERVPLQREITHPHKQLQHLAGRYLLQYLYPDFPYHLIEIADTRKPYLPNEEYHFSISHCGDYAAVIVSRDHRVGIDIELVNEKVEKIRHKFLSDEERSELEVLRFAKDDNENYLTTLTLLWSCKEAVFKWYGYGGVDFRSHIHLEPHEQEEKIKCTFNKQRHILLEIDYKIFPGMSMAWVASP